MGGIPEEFLTVAEIPATLKVNDQTIRNWLEAGTLPAYHLGGGRTADGRLLDLGTIALARLAGLWQAPAPRGHLPFGESSRRLNLVIRLPQALLGRVSYHTNLLAGLGRAASG